jgi:hypothetical protein
MSTTQVPARAQSQYTVWQKLPTSPMTEAEFDAAIMAALGRGVGSEADRDAMRFLLVSSDSVKARRFEDGVMRYKRAETFPQHPRNDIGSRAFDQQTKELAQEQERQHDRDAAAAFKNSPQNRQRQEMIALIDSRIDERLVELRALTAELRALRDELHALAGSAETTQARRKRVEEGLQAATNGGAG